MLCRSSLLIIFLSLQSCIADFDEDLRFNTQHCTRHSFHFSSFLIPNLNIPSIHRLPIPINHKYSEYFVHLGNSQIRVIETGNPTQTPVILLHGATFRAELWKTLGTMKHLASKGYRVLSVDLPRHGESGNPQLSNDLLISEFADTLKLGMFNIVAHSYGGFYALPALANNPHRIISAVLISPTHITKYAADLKNVEANTLILWGEKDELIPVRKAYLLSELLEYSQLEIIPSASHECYLDNVTVFHEKILEFFIKNKIHTTL